MSPEEIRIAIVNLKQEMANTDSTDPKLFRLWNALTQLQDSLIRELNKELKAA